MFSQRSQFEAAEDQAVDTGGPVIDLTVSNPTACGLIPTPEALGNPWSNPAAQLYVPDAQGLLSARQAVAAYYGDGVDPAHIFLTAGTSEMYSYLFRLLCNPGESILVPQQGYPLFDVLMQLDGVHLATYPLRYDHGWQIDLQALEAAITPATRAILLVHPNNPTGHYTAPQEREALYTLAVRHNLALIVDEVFLDHPVEAPMQPSFAAPGAPSLTFVLSGLSKVCALPQMKVSWTTLCGPQDLVAEAARRIEIMADSFLNVSTPSQIGLPHWLLHRHALQQEIRTRVLANLQTLDDAIRGTAITRLRVDAGWVAVLRVPALQPDTELTHQLRQNHGILVHPGNFYGFPSAGWLVISLLPEPDVFQTGVCKIVNGINSVTTPSSID